MKIADALRLATSLIQAAEVAKNDGRETLTDTDLDQLAAIDDAAREKLQAAIDRKRAEQVV